MKKLFFYCLLSLLSTETFAQLSNYQSVNNLLYWKNRKPLEGYWQQDVHYKIKARIDDKTDIVDGHEDLTYVNNSPDTLSFVYFHLYSNAQTKGSYLSNLYENNGYDLKFGKYQKQGKGTDIIKITSDGQDLKTEFDNTIIKVWLNQSLNPNESVSFSIDFKTYFDYGTIRNRMKMFNSWGYKHYDLVHWYPRISVYDKKFGWDTDQHMDHEFYGDFGVFEAEITFPNDYILDATGVLQNPSEVMPNDLRQKLDIKNFKNKPWGEKPSVVIPRDSTKKTWKFYAENVHDFALTADPTYRIGETEWNGVKCISLCQEPHASLWQNTADYTAKVIKVYSEDFGMYAYPKMIVADAQDGMEYPMLTLCGGYEPIYHDLIAHEVGHNWFFGMVGSNETYRAMLDEGFTQFIESWAIERIDGLERISPKPASNYVEKFKERDLIRNSEVYNRYIFDAARGDETTLNTHSDGFKGAIRHGGGYGQVYSKTAVMLYNLQYVLGDDLFQQAMSHYFNQWKICHPYVEDFRNSIINFTKVDLNWFFDQWIETSKTIDYEIEDVKRGKEKGEYIITIEREGGMQMPIDFTVIDKNEVAHDFHIPNNWFVKKTDATVLPKWIGWDKVNPTYEAHVNIPAGIQDVMIDTTHRLADVNMLNNSNKFPVEMKFDSKIYNPPSWTHYELFYGPDIWYNSYDGLKLGLSVRGSYMNRFDAFDATFWMNSQIAQAKYDSTVRINKNDGISWRFNYRTPYDDIIEGSSFYCTLKQLDGLDSYLAGIDRENKSKTDRVYLFFKSIIRKDSTDLIYLLNPDEWAVNKLNNTFTVGIEHKYTYKIGTGNINLSLRSSTLMSDYNYANINLTVVNKNRLGKLLNFNTRTIVQYGTGNDSPNESALYLAGASPEEMMESKYNRSVGIVPQDWAGYGATTNYFHVGGGLNLRGYAGYLAPQEDTAGNVRLTYKGNAGAALNAELEFDQALKKILPKLRGGFANKMRNTFKINTYLFGDIGIINDNTPFEDFMLADFRADAGVGTTLTIKKWGPLQTADPLTIRFDMPLFLNRIPNTDKDFVQFRWIVGISRIF